MSALSKHDYPALIEEYHQRRDRGESHQAIKATFESRGINWGTFQNRRTQWNKAHRSTPQEHLSTPEHQGTLEGHQEVMEEVHQSVPDAPHLGTEEIYQSTPEHLSTPTPIELSPDEQYTQAHHNIPDDPTISAVHPGTPEAHQNVSLEDSGVLSVHYGVPARQEWPTSTPMVHPGTPTAEDWELWNTIKARWLEVEKMLAERHTRQALLSIPTGTPRHTVKKTYVVDTFYVELIDRYAKEHSLDLKDVLNVAFQRFFEQEGYLRE